MSNVIRGKFVTEIVWQCTNCGNQKFYLHVDGRVECWECDQIQKVRCFDPDEKGPTE